MAMQKIKKDDVVIVLTGDDKGKKGKILRVLEKRLIVEGINLVKKHVKGNPQTGERGGVIDREASIAVSNVALASTIKGAKSNSKIGFKFLEDGRKVRYFKSSGELVDVG